MPTISITYKLEELGDGLKRLTADIKGLDTLFNGATIQADKFQKKDV